MKKIVILGGGESGFGSAVLAKKEGFDVFLSDNGAISDKYKKLLDEYEIEYEEKVHTLSRITNSDIVIKSPGIPDSIDLIKTLKKSGIPVISEIEFAGRYCKAKTICVTGSNGKTTTTTLIYEILKNAGINVGLGGNIGSSFAFQVATQNFDWYVLELSSFQLDGMYDFKADIAVLTNITPDHLDRYEYKMENYVSSKFRITNNMGANELFIYCKDDPYSQNYVLNHKEFFNMNTLPFSVKDSIVEGAFINSNGLIEINVSNKEFIIDQSKLKIKGIHNIYNVMAAVLAVIELTDKYDAILDTLYKFNGVEHRLEFICEKSNIEFINDSKATNVDSVWYALESMKRPTIWIAGGTDKGNDYAQIEEIAKEKVKSLICMGVDNSKLENFFKDKLTDVYSTSSLEEAIGIIKDIAQDGDTVLLSPACASFDLFKNYEDRGEKFKKAILNLDI